MRTLIIEDNDDIAECIQQSLCDMGIASDWFAEGKEVREAFRTEDYDLLILDLNLPDADGLKILQEFRKRGQDTPVLIISARSSIDDRVSGLDCGADDYLSKPFDLHELDARVRALLRRNKNTRNPLITFGPLQFNQSSREFSLANQPLDLSPRERAVLEILLRQNGQVISKDNIALHVFNYEDEASVSSIELYIHRLRKKLCDSGVSVVTKRGLGYALQLETDQGRV
ncbi:response regulator [Pseudomonadales bacterium]|uniref:response regulator n=1 Tax=Oceanicoccus sp. TaxID=2691044 RepID=UPI002375D790|nr:response regulator [Oceanicoccus sp.]MCP3907625.1 response regulator [Oceanicoccus sp.]MDB4528477.1 response regulator [Pseudomonadales bacterium]MDB4631635.1 response regulator [Pseudomonadales bacterium]MDG1773589.1 response regulator [Oceanicoccus sp.]